MKKFLALALALVMALALAVPAMAFTDKGVAEDYVPSLGIELVEFENDAFFGIVGAEQDQDLLLCQPGNR